jgi:hypothetical protein
MPISAINSAAYLAPQSTIAAARSSTQSAAASIASTQTIGASTENPPAHNYLDFTSATRQEIFDWMNGEIRAGRMTLDESTPFLGMTLKMSAATFEPVDMATDSERINYIEKAKLGIEWAQSHGLRDEVARLRQAVSTMQQVIAQPPKLDVVA